MYNLTLSKAPIDMQPLHTLLYVEPCIGTKHVLAAPAFVPQAALACSLSASLLYHRFVCCPCSSQTLQMTSRWQGCIKSFDNTKMANWHQIGVYTSIRICSHAAGRLHGLLYGWSLDSSNVSERQDRVWGSMLRPAI